VDTSVFGGVFDAEFADHSRAFFRRIQQGEVVVLVGDITESELLDAPERVRAMREGLPSTACIRCHGSPETATLTDAYLKAGVVGAKWRGDANQVATATIHRADVLVSWNFRHIVRFDRVRAFNAVNERHGYPSLYICSPAEVRYGRQE
jgi:hypothetical protein